MLRLVRHLPLVQQWSEYFARLYGIRLGCALCKVTGFDGAVAAFLAGSMIGADTDDAFMGVFHPFIQGVLMTWTVWFVVDSTCS